MYLVRAIKTFTDSQAPTVEESLRKPGVEFKVTSKERVNLMLSLGLIEVIEEPKVEEPKIEKEITKPKEEKVEPKGEEIVKPKSYNGGRKNGRKQNTNMARKNR